MTWETGSYLKSNSGLWQPSWQNISAMKVYKLLVWYVVPLSLAWSMCESCSLQVHALPQDDDGVELGTQHMAAALCSVLGPGGDWGSGGWNDHWPTGACRTTLNCLHTQVCMQWDFLKHSDICLQTEQDLELVRWSSWGNSEQAAHCWLATFHGTQQDLWLSTTASQVAS